jgi:hypothetical protein
MSTSFIASDASAAAREESNGSALRPFVPMWQEDAPRDA